MPIPYQPPAPVQHYTLPAGYRLSRITADLGDVPWGRVDEHRVEWHMTGTLEGWWDSPGVAAVNTEKPYGHGVWAGPGWWEPRIITLTGVIVAPTEEARDAALERLALACPLAPTGLLRVDSIPPTQAAIRLTSNGLKIDKQTRTRAVVQVQLLAPDPLRYSVEVVLVPLWAVDSSGGLTVPAVPPLVLASPMPAGMVVKNAGTAATGWQATIPGPAPSPRITNLTTGRVVGFDLDVPAGAALWLDSATGRAELGGADVSGAISNGTNWWHLPRGTSRIALTAINPASAVRAQLTYRHAWS